MGRSKADLKFGHETLLQRVAGRLSQSVDTIVVVAAADQSLPELPPNTIVSRDRLTHAGPLAGLSVGLKALRPSSRNAAYVTGCDVPFLCPRLVDELFGLLGEHDVVVPFDAQFLHPLSAIYRVDVLGTVQDLVDQGERRPRVLFDRLHTLRVATESLRRWDPDLRSLHNMNTPADYRAALTLADLPIPDWLDLESPGDKDLR